MNNQPFTEKSTLVMLTLVTLLSLAAPVMAQENKVVSGRTLPISPSQQLDPTNPIELGSFPDGLLAQEMKENHIAGAAVSVVKDGKLFFCQRLRLR